MRASVEKCGERRTVILTRPAPQLALITDHIHECPQRPVSLHISETAT